MQFGKALEFDQRIHAKFGNTFGFVFTNLVHFSNFIHLLLIFGPRQFGKGVGRGPSWSDSGLVEGAELIIFYFMWM